jgi:hypothetical protein
MKNLLIKKIYYDIPENLCPLTYVVALSGLRKKISEFFGNAPNLSVDISFLFT